MIKLGNKNKINLQTYTTNSCYKVTILFLATIFCAIFINTPTVNAKMLNKFKKGFYFEKYSTAEEAKNELLKLHPIGSDFEDVIKTLEKAGTRVEERNMNNYQKFYPVEFKKWKNSGNYKSYNIYYDNASIFFVFFNKLIWSGDIWINRENKITLINLNKTREY